MISKVSRQTAQTESAQQAPHPSSPIGHADIWVLLVHFSNVIFY